MNKHTLIGTLISFIILLLIPMSPIVQFSKAKETHEQVIYEDINNMIATLITQEMFPTEYIRNDFFTNFVALLSQSHIVQKYLTVTDESRDDDPQSLCFPFLGIFIYGLIAYAILKIISFILRDIGSFFRNIRNNIRTSIMSFIIKIINVIRFVVQLLIFVIQGIYTLLFKTGEFIGTIIVTIVSAIFAVVLFILNVIASILQGIWHGIGTFFGLILEILKLIYDTIFSFNMAT